MRHVEGYQAKGGTELLRIMKRRIPDFFCCIFLTPKISSNNIAYRKSVLDTIVIFMQFIVVVIARNNI